MSSFQEFDEVKLQLLVDLIASGTLDIKIATLTSVGIYHDKLGIIKDFEGNAIVFSAQPIQASMPIKTTMRKFV